MPLPTLRIIGLITSVLILGACSAGSSNSSTSKPPTSASEVPQATPRATCGAGSRPETGIQGRVSREDHANGLPRLGFTCNTEMVGSYIKPNNLGTLGGFKVERYTDAAGHDCAYYDTTLLFPTNLIDAQGGVNVLDMSDPTKPVLTAQLVTPAMLSPHESLVLSKERGVLAAVLAALALLGLLLGAGSRLWRREAR